MLSLLTFPSLTAESRSTVGCDVQQCFWQDSVLLKTLDKYVPLPFRQFTAILVHKKRKMSKGGRPPSQGTIHEKMFGCWNKPLWSSQNMADPHIMIIYYVGKVIGRKSICFYHYRVTFHLKNKRKQKRAVRYFVQTKWVNSVFFFSSLSSSLSPTPTMKAYRPFWVWGFLLFKRHFSLQIAKCMLAEECWVSVNEYWKA